MAIYITLNNFTEQGIHNIKDTTKRADVAREMGKKFGVTLKELYWTLGKCDQVGIFKAPVGYIDGGIFGECRCHGQC